MYDRHGSVRVERDVVLAAITPELGRVDGRRTRTDRALDVDAPRIEPLRIRKHVVDQVARIPGPLDGPVVQRRDQLDVEPPVPVDEVVAGPASDEVAAAAAEQDVAGLPGERDVESGRPHQLGQSGDLRGARGGQLHTRQVLTLGGSRGIVHAIIPLDVIVEVPARRAIHQAIPVPEVVEVQDDSGLSEQIQLDVGRDRPASLRDPVESVIAEELVAAFGHQHDVVAAFAPVVVLARAATEDVVAAFLVEAGEEVKDVPVVAEDAAVVAVAVVDPVVAGAAEDAFAAHRSIDDDVVAGAAEVLDAVVAADEEVIPLAADDDVSAEPRSAADGIVAGSAAEVVVAVAAKEDVVAGTAEQPVVAFAAVQAIVAVVAVHRVVTDVAPEFVVARTAVEEDVQPPVERIEELRGPIAEREERGALRIERAEGARRIEDEIGKLEDVAHGSLD